MMQLSKVGEAGAAESGDILVTVTPAQEAGIQVELTGKPGHPQTVRQADQRADC